MALAIIYPAHQNQGRLELSIADARAKIREQEVLFPIYQRLRSELGAHAPKAGSLRPHGGLSTEKMADLFSLFSGIASKCGMQITAVTPDVKGLTKDSHFVSVDLSLKGDFFHLRRFLIKLSELEYMRHIEQLLIEQGPSGKKYHLRVLLGVQANGAASGAAGLQKRDSQ
ncbi:MAG: hypothetical protein ACP5IL_03630 [Syntrophobacteraceae bacterium]